MAATVVNNDAIAMLAYQYWEADRRPDGRDLEHWLKAESALKAGSLKQNAHVSKRSKLAQLRGRGLDSGRKR